MAGYGITGGVQRKKDVDELGKRKAPWRVFWNDPSGKRREKKCGTKTLAKKERQRIHDALVNNRYEQLMRSDWPDFREQYVKEVRRLVWAS